MPSGELEGLFDTVPNERLIEVSKKQSSLELSRSLGENGLHVRWPSPSGV